LQDSTPTFLMVSTSKPDLPLEGLTPPTKEENLRSHIVPTWYPPGADAQDEEQKQRCPPFEWHFPRRFFIPSRIASRNSDLMEAVNDFHFAMMNDHGRNKFYLDALRKVISKDSLVVEVGTGSGLLAMICAQLGAKHVTAIEANRSLAGLARHNMRQNGLEGRVTVLNKMSTDVTEADLPHGRADVLVSEILGTLMLSESALEYMEDARLRLLKPLHNHVIPHSGVQYVTLVQCPKLDTITTARTWNGLDFSGFNALKDTVTLFFTKQIGCRVNTLDYINMTERLPLLTVDFSRDKHGEYPKEQRIRTRVKAAGTVHAAVYSWEVRSSNLSMATHLEATKDNFARDMQWGQGVQMLDDYVASEQLTMDRKSDDDGGGNAPSMPLYVEEGEVIDVVVLFADDGILMQCLVERVDAQGNAIGLEQFYDSNGSSSISSPVSEKTENNMVQAEIKKLDITEAGEKD